MSDLSHIDDAGRARMVDVSGREVTVRTAVATAVVHTRAAARIAEGTVAKGDVLAVARVAGIMAAKRTSELIPMCHPLALHAVQVDLTVDPAGRVHITATARTADRTGVEMEALTAASVAALTVIDMTKSVDPAATITQVQLESKDGGRSGRWQR